MGLEFESLVAGFSLEGVLLVSLKMRSKITWDQLRLLGRRAWSLPSVLVGGRLALVLSVLCVLAAPLAGWAQDPETPETKPESSQENDDTAPDESVERLTVLGTALGSYLPFGPTAGSRLNMELMEIPKAVQVVPREVIDDQQAITPNEVTRNVSAVQQAGANYGNDERFIIRGFRQQNAYKDGIRGSPVDGWSDNVAATDVANLEAVEVIKGPAAILFGRVEPGGVVNYITKRPGPQNAAFFRQRFGSFDLYRTEVDLNAATADGTVAGRVVSAYQNSGGFVDFTGGERAFFAGALYWRIGGKTHVRLRSEFLYDQTIGPVGLPVVQAGDSPDKRRLLPGVPYDQFLGEPEISGRTTKAFEQFVEIVHQPSDAVTLTFRGAYLPTWTTNRDIELWTWVPPFWNPESETLARTFFDGRFDAWNATAQLWAATKYEIPVSWLPAALAQIEGELLAGLEWNRRQADGSRVIAQFSRINPFQPVYTGYELAPEPRLESLETSDYSAEEFSLVAENRLSLGGGVVLLAGVRTGYTEVKTSFSFDPIIFPPVGGSLYEAPVSPFVGLLMRPWEPLALFASYSTSYQPPRVPTKTEEGSDIKSETGEQWEVGLKWESDGGRLMAGVSGFSVKRRDMVTADPFNPVFYFNIGEQKTRGFEFDMGGEILEGWRVIASYAFLDARITEDALLGQEGNQLWAVPRNSGSVWTTYNFTDGMLDGLGAGFGVFVTGSIPNDNANTLELPARVSLDAMVSYRWGPVEFRLNGNNLTNQKAYLPVNTAYRVFPVPPLNFMGSIALRL